ncbi:MAG: PP2C family serine/threonine-protein phosphatase [Xanthomonadales bacterium]|nr:PP2C family serine/threonine-protein phosphatase [Xanthomonadales bacterium]
MIEFGHGTHVGLRRDHNEDTYSVEAGIGLWLVADGMGGHDQGEVASAIARDTVVEHFRGGEPLTESIRAAAQRIIDISNARKSSLPMGTTLVAAAVDLEANDYEVAWVGDSRVYHWNGKLYQLTSDHSYVQELVDQGAITPEQARTHPHRNVVTQALGVTEPASLKVDTVEGHLEPGEMLLLCSDGLTEEVDDDYITDVLAAEDTDAQEKVDRLILGALDGGGSDNITVLLLARAD